MTPQRSYIERTEDALHAWREAFMHPGETDEQAIARIKKQLEAAEVQQPR